MKTRFQLNLMESGKSILRRLECNWCQLEAWLMRFGEIKGHRCHRKKYGFLTRSTQDRAFKANLKTSPQRWARAAT